MYDMKLFQAPLFSYFVLCKKKLWAREIQCARTYVSFLLRKVEITEARLIFATLILFHRSDIYHSWYNRTFLQFSLKHTVAVLRFFLFNRITSCHWNAITIATSFLRLHRAGFKAVRIYDVRVLCTIGTSQIPLMYLQTRVAKTRQSHYYQQINPGAFDAPLSRSKKSAVK